MNDYPGSRLQLQLPLRAVNPLMGTDSVFDFSHGNTLPLVTMPFGMTSWCPQTDVSPFFFQFRQPKIQGIRATHQPSPWMGDYGHFTIMPQTGETLLEPEVRASHYDRKATSFHPHYFNTFLTRYGVRLEMTVTERCAVFRFYPPSGERLRVLFQPIKGNSGIAFPDDRTVTGYTSGSSGGVPQNFACYFVARASRRYSTSAVIGNSHVETGRREGEGDRVGGLIEFTEGGDQPVELVVATSFISARQAAVNLENETAARSFERLCVEGSHRWNDLLDRIRVDTGEANEQSLFYSCLYRALLYPRKWYELTASGEKIHFSPYTGKVEPGILYADNGFWDTVRSVYPFLSLAYPVELEEILEGWLNAYRESRWFPKWSSPGHRSCMTGTHIDAVWSDALHKGFCGEHLDEVYEGLRKNAFESGDAAGRFGRKGLGDYHRLGYVPADEHIQSVAETLDYAYNDFCVGLVAGLAGREEDREILSRRALSYRNLFDRSVGFMRGRNADGSWLEPFDEFTWGGPYVEGGPWQWSFSVPHDPDGLIELYGGRNAFVEKLERMLYMPPHFRTGSYKKEIHEMTEMAAAEFGQYAHSNQPVHHILYLFTSAGRPDLTQYWAQRVMDEMYRPTPEGYAGDEDNGEMSCWFMLNALGLFPLCPGDARWTWSRPRYGEILVRRPHGDDLRIVAKHLSPSSPYTQQILVDGDVWPAPQIPHSAVDGAKQIEFVLSTSPVLREHRSLGRTRVP